MKKQFIIGMATIAMGTQVLAKSDLQQSQAVLSTAPDAKQAVETIKQDTVKKETLAVMSIDQQVDALDAGIDTLISRLQKSKDLSTEDKDAQIANLESMRTEALEILKKQDSQIDLLRNALNEEFVVGGIGFYTLGAETPVASLNRLVNRLPLMQNAESRLVVSGNLLGAIMYFTNKGARFTGSWDMSLLSDNSAKSLKDDAARDRTRFQKRAIQVRIFLVPRHNLSKLTVDDLGGKYVSAGLELDKNVGTLESAKGTWRGNVEYNTTTKDSALDIFRNPIEWLKQWGVISFVFAKQIGTQDFPTHFNVGASHVSTQFINQSATDLYKDVAPVIESMGESLKKAEAAQNNQ